MNKHAMRAVRILAQTLLLVICLAMLVCAAHAGHECASDMDCPICRLIDRQGDFSAVVFFAFIIFSLSAFPFTSERAARRGLPFSPLVRLHVQMND